MKRQIKEQIKQSLTCHKKSKITIIYGARQVGKTTLANQIIDELKLKTLKINADEFKYNDILSSRDKNKLESLVSGYELIFIDEAQRIENIGINLKILYDSFPELKILVTGSSSLDLANKIAEPLTGRTTTYKLFPIALSELKEELNPFETTNQIDERLVYGSYPEIFSIKNKQDKEDFLEELSNSYLYKDVLEITNIRHSNKMRKLLQLLAFQIGKEVSMTELGSQLALSKDTVEHYIDLLEKSFVLFRLSGFSKNLRKEITKMDKIYFYDLGIRNVLINNLQNLDNRHDKGELFENFVISEKLKSLAYSKNKNSLYFWRTYTGAELDLVESKADSLAAYEIKYSKSKAKAPKAWVENYGEDFSLINKENLLDFV